MKTKISATKNVGAALPYWPKPDSVKGKGTVGPTGTPPKKSGINTRGYSGGTKKS